MTDWKAMNQKVTPSWPDATLAQYAQGPRFRLEGEMQRRPGLAASTLPKLGGSIAAMWPGADYGGYSVTQVGGTITGERNPDVRWADIRIIPPTVIKGTPQAPHINSIAASPASPRPYQANTITFTPDITYDGLSGPLSYSWFQTIGPAAPNPSSSGADVFVTDFNGFCIPGFYGFELFVITADLVFSDSLPFGFTVS